MTSSANDVTANANNGTNAGAVTTVSGVAGDARSLNGAQYINLSGTSIAANASAITLSAWINRSGTPGGVGVACFSIHNGGVATGTSRFAFEVTGSTNYNGIGRTNDNNSGSLTTATNPFAAANTWYLATLVINYSANTLTFYNNGAFVNTGSGPNPVGPTPWSATTDNNSSPSAAIGAFDDGTLGFVGMMDEVRFSNSARSAAWLAADYKSMSDTFLSFGAEENSPGFK
jgi:Concanavalin A-like lectin/glucanases superfamily